MTAVSSNLGVLLKQASITFISQYDIASAMFWNKAPGEVEEKQVLLHHFSVISIQPANQSRLQ